MVVFLKKILITLFLMGLFFMGLLLRPGRCPFLVILKFDKILAARLTPQTRFWAAAEAIKSSGGRISFGAEVHPKQSSDMRSPIEKLIHNHIPKVDHLSQGKETFQCRVNIGRPQPALYQRLFFRLATLASYVTEGDSGRP